MTYDTCEVPNCQHDCNYKYYGHWICESCWQRECDEGDAFDLKKVFKISEHKLNKGI